MTAALSPTVATVLATPAVVTVPSMMVSVMAALNLVGYAGLFVLDSRVRGNDDLGMLPVRAWVASSGLVTVT